MNQFPFSITINSIAANDEPQTLRCIGMLRAMDRKRNVYDALWHQRPVIVKLFIDPLKARYHGKREWRGLKILQQRGLNAPKPLLYGKTERGGWAVVAEKITDAFTVRELYDATADTDGKAELISAVVAELAAQHSNGVIQTDLHLGNFLLKDRTVFALDPAGMRFISSQLPKSKSISYVALLTSIFPDEHRDSVDEIFRHYADVRSWTLSRLDWARLDKQLKFWRKNGIRRALKKCLRTNRRCRQIKQPGWRGVAANEFFETGDIKQFLEKIDELMQAGKILKDGNTCFVSIVNRAGRDIVIKRYNHKGLFHSFRHTTKRSRARRNWVHANRLCLLDIPTPKPIAYLEYKKGLLVWKSYFITQYVLSQNLHAFLNDKAVTEDRRRDIMTQIEKLLNRLTRNRITHGDLKQTNILVTTDGPVLTDLDSMRTHRYNCTIGDHREEDMNRLRGGPKE